MEKADSAERVRTKYVFGIATFFQVTGHSLARFIDACSEMVGELRPNFLAVTGLLAWMTFEVFSWVQLGGDLLLSHPETGVLYVDATAATAASIALLVIGILGASIKPLIEVAPPPLMTEQSAKEMMEQHQHMVLSMLRQQTETIAEIAVRQYEKTRKSAKKNRG